MNTIRVVQSCAILLALSACVRSRSILDENTEFPADSVIARSNVDLAELTPEERAALVAKQARDSALLDASGFFAREASQPDAYFLTSEEIDQMQPKTIGDIFRHVPGIIEKPGPPSPASRQSQGCFITYVNGLVRRVRGPSELDNLIPVREVLAAEVYPPGQLPPTPFAGPGTLSCTTVGIWTRS